MNKQQLINSVAISTTATKATVEEVLTAAFATMKEKVKKGDDVKIVGFGTFTKSKRKARVGRNPSTGASMKIPAGWYPKFRAGKEFKALVK
jgi:DNA-binding protein HU-beta